MKIIILMCLSISSYAQITITDYKTKLINTYSIDKVVDNQFQQSYRVTNIYDLSSQQIDIIKVNKTYSVTLYETNKFKQQEYYNPYSKVISGFEKKSKKQEEEDEFDN